MKMYSRYNKYAKLASVCLCHIINVTNAVKNVTKNFWVHSRFAAVSKK
jgi:hypothetical protein